MEKTTLDAFHEAVSILDRTADNLANKADACRELGLSRFADKLSAAIADIDRARNLVRTAAGEACSQALRGSTEASTNMINAALAGIAASHREADFRMEMESGED